MCNAKQALSKKRSAKCDLLLFQLGNGISVTCSHDRGLSLPPVVVLWMQIVLSVAKCANDRIITTSAQLPLLSEIFLDWILTETFRQDILDTLFQQEFADFNHRIHSYLESLMYVPFRMKLPALCSLLCFHFLRYSRNCVSLWNLQLRLR